MSYASSGGDNKSKEHYCGNPTPTKLGYNTDYRVRGNPPCVDDICRRSAALRCGALSLRRPFLGQMEKPGCYNRRPSHRRLNRQKGTSHNRAPRGLTEILITCACCMRELASPTALFWAEVPQSLEGSSRHQTHCRWSKLWSCRLCSGTKAPTRHHR